MRVTPTLGRSRLELWPVPVESSGTGLRGAARDSFKTLDSSINEAVLLREMDLNITGLNKSLLSQQLGNMLRLFTI